VEKIQHDSTFTSVLYFQQAFETSNGILKHIKKCNIENAVEKTTN
jgi:hypothetical protein